MDIPGCLHSQFIYQSLALFVLSYISSKLIDTQRALR